MIAEARFATTDRAPVVAIDPATVLEELDSGRLRAAEPDASAPDGWRVNPSLKVAILARFADRATTEWLVGPFAYRDRVGLPLASPAALADRGVRVVPGGTSIRGGAYLGDGVVVMPPSFVNIGAWIGPRTMVDSGVLVGSCAQIGADVHLSAGVVVGGVLEPPGARPVIVEDGGFVGAGAALLEGVLVGRRAVIGAGVTLTGTSRLFDLVDGRVIDGTRERPLVVPAGAVVVPGSRPLRGAFAEQHGLALATAVIVKRRDDRTDARTALEEALR
jgi:2,3,4,5-tetrahydropyridine-2,6-dicarboxylate N-succinyltransferase